LLHPQLSSLFSLYQTTHIRLHTMLSVRAILVVAAAFVSLASAIAVASDSGGLVAPPPVVPTVDARAVPNLVGTVADNSLKRRGNSQSVGDYCEASRNEIASIVVEINVMVSARVPGSDTDGKLSDFLAAIINALEDLISQIKGINVSDPTQLLYLDGVPCTIAQLAEVVYSLLALVVNLLVSLLGVADASILVLINSIGSLLAKIVILVVGLVPGLAAGLALFVVNIVAYILLLGTPCYEILVVLNLTTK